MQRVTPRLQSWLPWLAQLSPDTAKADLIAGITGAIVVLPQGIAYAIIAGLPPQYGLYAAMVLPVVAGLFGSSYHMVSGPVAPNSVLVASVLAGMALPGSESYIALAITLAFLVGLFQLGFGLARLGVLVHFVSYSVVVGFTAGAAVLILLSQIGNSLGMPAEEFAGGLAVLQAFQPAYLPRTAASLALFLLTLGLCLLIRWLRRRWPALLISMITASGLAGLMGVFGLAVPMVGAMPAALPPLSLPVFVPGVLQDLVPGALAIAALGLVQAVSVSRTIATRSGQRLDNNREFIGQGLSNVVGSFFSSYPGSGSMTRSGLNYDAGARTPIAGICSSLVLALILLATPGAGAHLPVPVVAGVIVMIAWGLFDRASIRWILRSSREEATVLAATFLTALLISLQFSIAVGVMLSLAFYLRQASNPRVVPVAPHPQRPNQGLRNARKHGLAECAALRILRLDGSLFFASADNVQRALQQLTAPPQPNRVLLVCHAVNLIDLSGAHMLVREAERLAEAGGELYLCGLRDQPRRTLERVAQGSRITSAHFFGDPVLALQVLAPECLEPSRPTVDAREFDAAAAAAQRKNEDQPGED